MKGKNVGAYATLIEHEYIDVDGEMDALRQQGYVCHHVYDWGNGEEKYITDMVRLDHDAHELAVKYNLEHVRGPFYRITDKTGMNPQKVSDAIGDKGEVDFSQEVQLTSMKPIEENAFYSQWHLANNFPLPGVAPDSHVHAVSAWGKLGNRGSPDVVIGVVDSGLDLTLVQDFPPEKMVDWAYFEGEDMITSRDRDADPTKLIDAPGDMPDGHIDHGTATAGVVTGATTGEGIVGVAPGCKLAFVKYADRLSGLAWYDTAMFLSRNAHVANFSIGFNIVSTNNFSWHEWLARVFYSLRGRDGTGLVTIWSAGNDNDPIYKPSQIPPNIERPFIANGSLSEPIVRDYFFNPAHLIENSIIVGACTSNKQRSHYSSYGVGLDVCAPSSNSPYIVSDVTTVGASIVTSIHKYTATNPDGIRADYGGTSAAAPIVTGVAALVKSANPSLTAFEIIDIIKQTCDKDMNLEPYPESKVIIDGEAYSTLPAYPGEFDENGWSAWFGYGKVNAYRAVKMALGE